MPPEPRFRRLAREGLLTPQTLAVLERRDAPFEGEPRLLAPEAFATLVALVERLRPPYDRPTAREIALRIDTGLAEGASDGWRYDEMPPDGEALAKGLAALEAEARAGGAPSFAELDDPDALIRALQRGETRIGWGVSSKRFMEDLLTGVVSHAYAHPTAQDAIGYVGYADAKGWDHLRIEDVREPWEA